MLLPPGYTSLQSMKNTMRMRKALGPRSASASTSYGERHRGGRSPRTVRDHRARLRDATNAGKLV